ncbi:MAG: pyridoxal phosphate-dependent decarboxylase family protein [Rubricoccaceae bacterium]
MNGRVYPDPTALVARALASIDAWEARHPPFARHTSLAVDEAALAAALDEYLVRLTAAPSGEAPGTYPFFHPRYAGQMLKPPHPVALAAYAAAQRLNPNNHALDGGPPTGQMEKEVVRDLGAMLGLPEDALGHLTGGGTVANLEALFVARELAPGRAIAVSEDAHYTHARMAHVLGVEVVTVPADDAGRIRLDALEDVLRGGRVGTVVLTAGTTGLGAVDPLAEALPLARRYGARVHVDAAYGGFFTLLAQPGAPALEGFPATHFRAIADADSVVIDPHKHGLQPYGCGAILFRDPSVGRFYAHDSPYTYFSSDALHLGEISLECSRPGAAAGALWLTLRVLPLTPAAGGLADVLAAGLRAARAWAALIQAEDSLALCAAPETDIVAFAPRAATASGVDQAAQAVFDAALASDDPLYLSLYRLASERLARRVSGLAADVPQARVLRSVLMKPEHEGAVPDLHARTCALAAHVSS